MAEYAITGVWKAVNGVITHYAVHTTLDGTLIVSKAQKVTKLEMIARLREANTAYTWMWNYHHRRWTKQEQVQIVNIMPFGEAYLRSNPDTNLTDNLGHLIDFETIM